MGNKSSTLVNSAVNVVNAIAIDSVLSRTNNVNRATSSEQSQKIVFGKGCVAKNSTFIQKSNIKISFSGTFNDQQTDDIMDKLKNSLTNSLDKQEDPFLQGLGAVLNPGGKKESRTNTITNITNTISKTFKKETFTAIANALNNKQTQDVLCLGKIDKINVTQEFLADIADKIKDSSTTLNKLVRDAENNAKNMTKTAEKSELLEGLVNGLFGWRAAAAGALGDVATALLGGDKNNAMAAMGPPPVGSGSGSGGASTSPGTASDDNSAWVFGGVAGVSSLSCVSCVCILAIVVLMSASA